MGYQFIGADPSGELRQAAMSFYLFTILLALLHYSSAMPTVSAKISGGLRSGQEVCVDEGNASYVDTDLPDPQASQLRINIICTWTYKDLREGIDSFTIWWKSQWNSSEQLLYKGTTAISGVSGNFTLNSSTFRSGMYGCTLRQGDAVTKSTDGIYLSTAPKAHVVEEQDDDTKAAILFCSVTDHFDAFPNVHVARKVEFCIADTNASAHRNLSSLPADEWQTDAKGTTLTIFNVQKWAMEKRSVVCRVTSPTSAVKNQGDFYLSEYVPITYTATNSTPPTTTPSPSPTLPSPSTALPITYIAAGVGTPLVVLVLVVPLVLIVIVLKRFKKRRIANADVEQGLQERFPHREPCLGQGPFLPQALMDKREHGVGASRQASYDPNPLSVVDLTGDCVMPDFSVDDPSQPRQQADGQS